MRGMPGKYQGYVTDAHQSIAEETFTQIGGVFTITL